MLRIIRGNFFYSESFAFFKSCHCRYWSKGSSQSAVFWKKVIKALISWPFEGCIYTVLLKESQNCICSVLFYFYVCSYLKVMLANFNIKINDLWSGLVFICQFNKIIILRCQIFQIDFQPFNLTAVQLSSALGRRYMSKSVSSWVIQI